MEFFDVLLDELHWSFNTNKPFFTVTHVDLHCSDLINRHIQDHLQRRITNQAVICTQSDLVHDKLEDGQFRVKSIQAEGYNIEIYVDRASGFEFKLKTI